jgi:hypothetical protein
MSNPTTALIELRRHYEQVVAQSERQLTLASAQLKQIDALLLNGVLQGQELSTLKTLNIALELPVLPSSTATTAAPAPQEIATPSSTSTPARTSVSTAIAPQPTATQSDRTPRPLLPAYEGLKRLEAISKALQTTPGQEMTIGRLIAELFGPLSAADRKSESKRLYTLLYNGEKQGLWKKGKAPQSYLTSQSKGVRNSKPPAEALESSAPISPSPKPKALANKSSGGRDSLPLLPEFEGMNKLEAISKVLTGQSGHVLHQDSILQMLYGDLSPDVLKGETRKLRASLFQGVSKGLWQKAPKQPSSYLTKATKGRKANNVSGNNGSAPVEVAAAPAESPASDEAEVESIAASSASGTQSKRTSSSSKKTSPAKAKGRSKSTSRGRK